jgi:fatty-acyl-CoA synthase
VELVPGQGDVEADLMAWCRQNLAGYKLPKRFVFGPIQRTSTGKVQKFALRAQAQRLAE